MDSIEEINAQFEELMKKYKLTMYGMMACIVVYLICLFWVKNLWIVLIVCVPMIALAVYNSRISKQVRELAARRNQLKAREDAAARAALTGEEVDGQDMGIGAENLDEAIVANATSLNDLPKEYTVLDQVELDGQEIPHVILSPYGIAVVDSTDRTAQIEALLQELEVESPVYMYEPSEDIALLAERIQLPKEVALTESDIYKILYRISGLK